MTDSDISHRISFLEREYRRRKLVLGHSGEVKRTRGEFVETDTRHDPEYAASVAKSSKTWTKLSLTLEHKM